jgi:NCS1 family nucleobase:cation symporter-1
MITRDFIGFVIFHLLSIPAMVCLEFFLSAAVYSDLIVTQFIRPEKAKNPVAIANVVTFFVMMSICIWATVRGGTGPLIHKGEVFTAMPKGWAWLYGISSSVGGVASGVLNQSE